MKLTKQQLTLAKRISASSNKPLKHGIEVVTRRLLRTNSKLTQYGSVRKAQSYFMA